MLQKSFGRIRWKSLVQPWQHTDWLLFRAACGLDSVWGVMIRSTELNQGWTDWYQHWIIGAIGFVIALVIARVRYDA
jgi:rod shape determining protein RodA